ncbi:MAG: hypothetical protein ACYDH1_17800 [Anaerolineaceae bacterium]
MEDLWATRNKSLIWVKSELKEEYKIICEGFNFLIEFPDIFQIIAQEEGESEIGQFFRACTAINGKFNFLLLGCLSLCMDGLAQEAGALLRPAIEAYELLIYFQKDKGRLNEYFEDKLPSAGNIARTISGDFKDLREYYNDYASHFSLKYDSIRHILNSDWSIIKLPRQSIKVFQKNLEIINAFQIFMIGQLITCLTNEKQQHLVSKNNYEMWYENSLKIFKNNPAI